MAEVLRDQTVNYRERRWPGVAMITGGAVMLLVWPIFTTLHGPTSVNQGGKFLGFGPEFWSAMMEGPSLLLMAAGLFGARRRFTANATRGGGVGLALALVGLVVPAIANLVALAVWPPLLAPLLGVGLILIARGQRGRRGVGRFERWVLYGMGATQLFAFGWFLLVRPDVLDQIDGYRIYGIVANVAFGLGWILLGASILNSSGAVPAVSR